jgi:glyoxylase-like metal-dependent hydrolase (beta-lactamase superfamily II)
MVIELHYGRTNTYLIKGSERYVLFDTGWAGELDQFFKAIGQACVRIDDIGYLFISHFHPDHMGLAGRLSDLGISVVIADVQKEYVHHADQVFIKENNKDFVCINDTALKIISISESRSFLHDMGIEGELLHTPGHSDDSVSLLLDEGIVLVGDLNPLYELELHKGSAIADSWSLIFDRAKAVSKADQLRVYYGHARPAEESLNTIRTTAAKNISPKRSTTNDTVSCIIKLLGKGYPIEKIVRKTGADRELVTDVVRMYVTHPGVSVEGILDRIEIKGR